MFGFFKKRTTPPPIPGAEPLPPAASKESSLDDALEMRRTGGPSAIFEMLHTLSHAQLFYLVSEEQSMLVSKDGEGHILLATFSQEKHAEAVRAEHPGYSLSTAISAVQTIGGLKKDSGLVINLGHPTLEWVISPDLAEDIRQIFIDSNLLPPVPPTAENTKFRPGQVWAFHGDPSEPESRVIILQVDRLKVDEDKSINLVHIAITGLKLPNEVSEIGHMPFAEDALETSLTTLVSAKDPVPDYKEGYERWRWGRGGFFTVSVREAIDGIREALAKTPQND